jgi:hypothetical protein
MGAQLMQSTWVHFYLLFAGSLWAIYFVVCLRQPPNPPGAATRRGVPASNKRSNDHAVTP